MLANHYLGKPVTVPLGPNLSKFDRECLRLLYAGYRAYYGSPVGVREVEVLREVPLAGHVLVVKLDALIDADDEVVIMDHKFTGSSLAPGGFFWERFTLDAQVSLYWLACQAMGLTPGRFTVDAIRRPVTRAKDKMSALARIEESIGTEPESWFQRQDFYRTESDLKAATQDFVDLPKLLDIGVYPRNTGACFNYAERCGYWDTCSGVTPITDNGYYKDKEREEIQPSLVEP